MGSGSAISSPFLLNSTAAAAVCRTPFTAAQLQELEHQAKYLMAGMPVPPELLVPIRRKFDVMAARFYNHPDIGKISRRVCLVHYPEPSELERPSFNNPNLSSMRSGGSLRKSMSHLTSTHSVGQRSIESSKHSRKRGHEDSRPLAEASAKSLERSGASGLESQISNASLGSEPSHGEKSKKKRKIKLEE